ncbi:MAG: carbohydrate ABC transporter permease [Lachnospirales bacterium]
MTQRIKTKTWQKIGLRMLITILVLIVLFPLLIMVTTAFKSDAEVSKGIMHIFPETWMFSNFKTAMQQGNWLTYFKNSAIITGVAVPCSLIINSMSGYAFGRLKFKGNKIMFYFAMVGMMLPMQVIMIPVFLQIKQFPLVGGNDMFGLGGVGLINNLWGVILPLVAHPFGMFMCRNYYLGFPKELDEAAKIDGCSKWKVYVHLYLPIGKPILATLCLLKTVDTWNQYTWPLLVFNTSENYTVQLVLNNFKSESFTQWNYLMAATMLIVLPILVMFVFLQKYFVQGIATTGLKD